jgi:hypothetical protein
MIIANQQEESTSSSEIEISSSNIECRQVILGILIPTL